MTIEMDKKNTERAESPNTASPDADLSSLSFSSVVRQEAVAETVLFEGNGIVNTQTIPEVLSPTPGGASVPVTVIYGKNGSITFENGERAVAEGPETIAEVDIAGPSGRNSYSGNLSNENDVLGRDAGESVETTGRFQLGAA